jgi:L-amino acid N-acyltransferase YncA
MTIASNIIALPLQHKLVRETLDGIDFGLASPVDADELAGLYRQFFDEARYQDRGVVFDLDKVLAGLGEKSLFDRYPHIVARTHGDEIVGFVSYSLDSAFSVAPIAVMDVIYVVPERRRSALGRVLVALVLETAIGDGACAFHAPVASGTEASKSLLNLFKHAGFIEIGVIVGRSL